jgi:hypothetical protein
MKRRRHNLRNLSLLHLLSLRLKSPKIRLLLNRTRTGVNTLRLEVRSGTSNKDITGIASLKSLAGFLFATPVHVVNVTFLIFGTSSVIGVKTARLKILMVSVLSIFGAVLFAVGHVVARVELLDEFQAGLVGVVVCRLSFNVASVQFLVDFGFFFLGLTTVAMVSVEVLVESGLFLRNLVLDTASVEFLEEFWLVW